MTRAVYISPNDDRARASALGLSFILDPSSVPHVLIEGPGQSVVLAEPTTASAVQQAMQPFLDADAAAAAAAGQQNTNAETIRGKVSQALSTNSTYLALASPTAAQTTAQVKSLTREMNALLRYVFAQLSDISDT